MHLRSGAGLAVAVIALGCLCGVILATAPSPPPLVARVSPPEQDIVEIRESRAGTPVCNDPFTVAAVRELLVRRLGTSTIVVAGAQPDPSPVRRDPAMQVCQATVNTSDDVRRAVYTIRKRPGATSWILDATLER